MTSTCTITYSAPHRSMQNISTPPSPHQQQQHQSIRYTRAAPSSPSKRPHSYSSAAPKQTQLQMAVAAQTQTDISKLAALPSLSKSLNNLPSLAGHTAKDIPVYEGMPSIAQKSSHEKLRLALDNTGSLTKDKHERNGFYNSPFFAMTPMGTTGSQRPPPAPRTNSSTSASSPKQKTFNLYAEEDDEELDYA